MIATVILDKQNARYTNLDILSGKVILQVPSTTTVSHVTVKLEGESKTRLAGPAMSQSRAERPRMNLEIHKLLYKTHTLWPPSHVHIVSDSRASYSLNTGSYEWPFEFKLPLNNSCHSQPLSAAPQIKFGGYDLEVARPPTHHVKQTLPPSLSGFPGEAEIKYFVKVTVARPQFYKENLRAFADFTFLPIEPPRTAQDGEAYARRQHQFLPATADGEKRRSLLGSLTGSQPAEKRPTSLDSVPPRFSVDVRLPNPPVLRCNGEVPIRILLKQLSERHANVYLQSLQIELIGYTDVRSHELNRKESNSWIISSLSNMNIPIGSPQDAVNTETAINREYWYGNKLPNTVAPTFETCNLSRTYELEVRVGLGYGSYKRGEDQLVILPLRLPVKVHSGIAPPAALLDAMSQGAPAMPPRDSKTAAASNPSLQVPNYNQVSASHSPIDGPSGGFGAQYPAAAGVPSQPQRPTQPEYDEPPPSYEDAIGANIPPVAGSRTNYDASPAASAAVAAAPASGHAPPTESMATMSLQQQAPASTNITTAANQSQPSQQPQTSQPPQVPQQPQPDAATSSTAPVTTHPTGLSSNNPFAPHNTGATTTSTNDNEERKNVRFGSVREI